VSSGQIDKKDLELFGTEMALTQGLTEKHKNLQNKVISSQKLIIAYSEELFSDRPQPQTKTENNPTLSNSQK